MILILENVIILHYFMHVTSACVETNHESQFGVVKNTCMGQLTTVKRAAQVYAANHAEIKFPADVTSAALLTFLKKTTGKFDNTHTCTYISSVQRHTHLNSSI